MTAIISKPAQNRLDSCALARPKWAKILKHTRGTLRIDVLVADAAVRVENAQQNGQIRGNTKLLGKYRLEQIADRQGAAFLDLAAVAQVDPIDGIHLTAEGQAAVGHAIAEKVQPLFGPAS